jgi:putative endonuclease
MSFKKQTGSFGEDASVAFLADKGYKILSRNWRYLKGEIDIVAKHENWLVFVEVKTRSTLDFGNPEEFVTPRQQKLIINTAHQFIVEYNREEEARFDVVGVVVQNNKVVQIDHIEHAFYPTL